MRLEIFVHFVLFLSNTVVKKNTKQYVINDTANAFGSPRLSRMMAGQAVDSGAKCNSIPYFTGGCAKSHSGPSVDPLPSQW